MAFDFLTLRVGDKTFEVDPEEFRVAAEDALRLMRNPQIAGVTVTVAVKPAPKPTTKTE